MFEVLAESIAAVKSFAARLDPAALTGAEAKVLVEQSGELERLAGAVRTLAAGRVAQTGAWIGPDGAFRDAGAWMASVTGTTVGRAKATIETAERLASLPETGAVLRAGALSEVQVDAIAAAASAAPDAEAALLHSRRSTGSAASSGPARWKPRLPRTRWNATRPLGSADGPAPGDLRRRRTRRDARTHRSHRPVHGRARTHRNRTVPTGPASGRREPPDALAFDAIIQMADDSAEVATKASGNRAPATVIVRVDHAALVRGTTEPGQTCEIAGIGPVPATVARKLADDSILKVLVHDTTDVHAVSHAGRTIPARLRTALEELFPECCIEGCHTDRHLEIDHNIPIAEGGPTALWNLTRPCHHHHDHKHTHNLRIVGQGTRRHLEPAPRTADRAPPDP